MNVVILSIGDELLSGNTVNTNFSWIARKLSDIGCSITYQATAPDSKSSIVPFNSSNSDLISSIPIAVNL